MRWQVTYSDGATCEHEADMLSIEGGALVFANTVYGPQHGDRELVVAIGPGAWRDVTRIDPTVDNSVAKLASTVAQPATHPSWGLGS